MSEETLTKDQVYYILKETYEEIDRIISLNDVLSIPEMVKQFEDEIRNTLSRLESAYQLTPVPSDISPNIVTTQGLSTN
jgi:hypothetical protein